MPIQSPEMPFSLPISDDNSFHPIFPKNFDAIERARQKRAFCVFYVAVV
jgi:hypothetical protein